jgi:hypothetical protein
VRVTVSAGTYQGRLCFAFVVANPRDGRQLCAGPVAEVTETLKGRGYRVDPGTGTWTRAAALEAVEVPA